MAGSKVSAAAITASTATIVPTARPTRYCWPISSSPSSEMMTVVPANRTARPAVDMARTTASRGASPRQPLAEPLPVPGHDEQGVVDPDAEPDHGHQFRAEAGVDQQVADQRHNRVAGAHSGQCGKDGQAHRDDRPEDHQHDDDRRGDAEAFARA